MSAEGRAEVRAVGLIAKAAEPLLKRASGPAGRAVAQDTGQAAGADAARAGERLGRELDGITTPGPFAGESIPARGPERNWTVGERREIDRIGRDTGCHRCGATDPGTKAGHHVPDHQPPSQLNVEADPQRLYPHCIDCSRKQGGIIAAQTRRIGLR